MKPTDKHTEMSRGDSVLQELRRAKDELSAAYGHDLDKLFSQLREREHMSSHPVVNLQTRKSDER